MVLEAVRRGPAVTRRGIGELTGISRSLVAQIVAELIEAGLVVERALRPAGAGPGRPAAVLLPRRTDARTGALAFSHGRIRVAVGDQQGVVLGEHSVEFGVDRDAVAAVRAGRSLLVEALEALDDDLRSLRALTVAVPFPVGADGTTRGHAPITGWRSLDVATTIRMPPATRVAVDNDGNLGAWGEYVHAGRCESSLLFVKAGDGLGAGLVVDGAMFHGTHGAAAELGHVQVDPDGARCRCGRFGCLETVVDLRRPVESGRALGAVVAGVCRFLDPSVVVVGGELGEAGPALVAAMGETLREAGVDDDRAAALPVREAALGVRAELLGALDRAAAAVWRLEAERIPAGSG